jgi:hypothetical protein
MDAFALSPDGADIVCDVSEVACNAVTVDALARLQFAVRRRGGRLRIRQPSADLLELIAFMGLCEVLGVEVER